MPKVRQGLLEQVAVQARADLANELAGSLLDPGSLVLRIVSSIVGSSKEV